MPCDSRVVLEITEDQLSSYVNELMETPVLKNLSQNTPNESLMTALTDFEAEAGVEMFSPNSNNGLTSEQVESIASALGMSSKQLMLQAEKALKASSGGNTSMNNLLGVIPPTIADKLWGGGHTKPIFVGTLNDLNQPLAKVIGPKGVKEGAQFTQQFVISTLDTSKTAGLRNFMIQLKRRVNSDEKRILRRKKEWLVATKVLLADLKSNPGFIQDLLQKINKLANDKRIDNIKVDEVTNTDIQYRDFSNVQNAECDFTATLTADYRYEVVDTPPDQVHIQTPEQVPQQEQPQFEVQEQVNV